MCKQAKSYFLVAIGVISLGSSGLVQSQAPYPVKPVKILVGAPAGGTGDLMARLVTKELSTWFNNRFVVENGRNGVITDELVAKSAPDGYTLTVVGSQHARYPALYTGLPFDIAKDFSCIGLIASMPYVLVVHPSLPVKNVSQLISFLKKNPKTVNYASASIGTGQHLSAELFKIMAGVDMEHVAYRGSAAALLDLLSGRIPIMFDNITLMLPHIKRGALRPLAITDNQRSPLLPDLPTVADSGLPEFEVLGYFAILGPAEVPHDRIQRLNRALNEVLGQPAVSNSLADRGAVSMGGSAEHCAAFIAREIEKWGNVIREAGIKMN